VNAGSPNDHLQPRFPVIPFAYTLPPIHRAALGIQSSSSFYLLEGPIRTCLRNFGSLEQLVLVRPYRLSVLMIGSSLDRETEAEGSLLPSINTSTAHLSLDAQRQRLPIYKHRQKLLWCVEKYRVVIVVGQTGCGKSTRRSQHPAELMIRDPTVPA